MIPSALLRVSAARVAPSWAATERVLYLVALRGTLRPTADDDACVVEAWQALSARLDRDWTALIESAPMPGAHARRWIEEARRRARALVAGLALGRGAAIDATARAALLVWAAAASWSDAPSGRWGELAALAADLARALDATVLDGWHEAETGHAATELRATMADVWATMEAGR